MDPLLKEILTVAFYSVLRSVISKPLNQSERNLHGEIEKKRNRAINEARTFYDRKRKSGKGRW